MSTLAASPTLPPLVPDDVQEVPIEEANWEESTNMLPLEPVIKVYSHVTSPNYVMPVRAAGPIIAPQLSVVLTASVRAPIVADEGDLGEGGLGICPVRSSDPHQRTCACT